MPNNMCCKAGSRGSKSTISLRARREAGPLSRTRWNVAQRTRLHHIVAQHSCVNELSYLFRRSRSQVATSPPLRTLAYPPILSVSTVLDLATLCTGFPLRRMPRPFVQQKLRRPPAQHDFPDCLQELKIRRRTRLRQLYEARLCRAEGCDLPACARRHYRMPWSSQVGLQRIISEGFVMWRTRCTCAQA